MLVGVLLAGAAVGAVGALVGALARESRTASLVGVLVVLPVVFLGLVPNEIVPVAAWISDVFPFVHAVRFFASALYDGSPWGDARPRGGLADRARGGLVSARSPAPLLAVRSGSVA